MAGPLVGLLAQGGSVWWSLVHTQVTPHPGGGLCASRAEPGQAGPWGTGWEPLGRESLQPQPLPLARGGLEGLHQDVHTSVTAWVPGAPEAMCATVQES